MEEERKYRNILNLKTLLTGLPNQLRYIKRFSNCRTVMNESVSDHSYYVSLIALFIAEYLELQPEEELSLLRRCIVHDIDEVLTGDIIHQVKYYNPEIRKGVKNMALELLAEMFKKILPDRWNNVWSSYFLQKDETIVGRVVSFCDYASAVAYVYEEVVGGNVFMLRNVDALLEDISKFKDEKYEFLSELVRQIEEIVDDLKSIRRDSWRLK